LTLQHLFTVHTEHILYILDVNFVRKFDYLLNGTICVWNCSLVGIMDDLLLLTTHLRLFYKFSTSLHWRSIIMNSIKRPSSMYCCPLPYSFMHTKFILTNSYSYKMDRVELLSWLLIHLIDLTDLTNLWTKRYKLYPLCLLYSFSVYYHPP